MKTVQQPADTVFKVALNDDVGSKTSQVGDPVSFTVQEDVLVGMCWCCLAAHRAVAW